MYVGLNGAVTNLTGFSPDQWDWANTQMLGSEPATLSIETGGIYTLTAAMYEDGLRLDRLLLTTDTTYLPTGSGPVETDRQIGAASTMETLTRTIVYTYDQLYRLSEADYSTHSAGSGQASEYFGYAYDPMGNQTAITETLESTIVTTYTYNAANQLATARADSDGITWYYTHDANGNLRRQTPGGTGPADGETRYTYDAANQLVQVELYTGGSYTLLSEATYNGDGGRMSLTTYALGVPQTISYVVGQEGQVLVSDDGTEATLYLHGRGLIAEYSSEWSYPLNDATNSVRQTVDETGAVTLARSYKPFGGLLQEEGIYETAFGYMGGQLDRLSGLLYANGRYYDPSAGRYLTPNRNFDPYRPGTLNPYAPLQGPGLWMFLPLVGLVLLRRRKDGPWRMLVLVLVISLSFSLTGCEGGPEPEPTPEEETPTNTPLPQPPTTPPEPLPLDDAPTHTPTSTPPPPIPTVGIEPPVAIAKPCPTPSDTPAPTPSKDDPTVDSLVRMLWEEQASEPQAVVAAATWIIRNRIEFNTNSPDYDSTNYDTKRFASPPWDNYITGIQAGVAAGEMKYFSGDWDKELISTYRETEYSRLVGVVQGVLTDEIGDQTGGALFFANVAYHSQETPDCFANNFEERIEEESKNQNKVIEYGRISGRASYFYYLKNASVNAIGLICDEE